MIVETVGIGFLHSPCTSFQKVRSRKSEHRSLLSAWLNGSRGHRKLQFVAVEAVPLFAFGFPPVTDLQMAETPFVCRLNGEAIRVPRMVLAPDRPFSCCATVERARSPSR